tara:strand:- start:21270 stop:21860 length:591 start_codon:yes stop_codon:yes gene_type:complete
MVLKYFVLGFFVKIITGFDDTITHIPLLSAVTKTRMGRIAFSIGSLLAIICAIIVAFFFASLIRDFAFARFITGFLIFGLAAFLYFDGFFTVPREKVEKKLVKFERISTKRFTKLLIFGFFASLITVIDDVIAYAPLFLSSSISSIGAIVGILLASLIEIYLVIMFSKKIMHIPYKVEIAVAGLVLLGIGTITGII